MKPAELGKRCAHPLWAMVRDGNVPPSVWDTIIIGGGPAGLSAALVWGRCCRDVLVGDAGTPRNWAAHEMHGFLPRAAGRTHEQRTDAR